MFNILDGWLSRDKKAINELAENHFLEAVKKYGDINQQKFEELPKVQYLMETFKFFKNEQLLDNID